MSTHSIKTIAQRILFISFSFPLSLSLSLTHNHSLIHSHSSKHSIKQFHHCNSLEKLRHWTAIKTRVFKRQEKSHQKFSGFVVSVVVVLYISWSKRDEKCQIEERKSSRIRIKWKKKKKTRTEWMKKNYIYFFYICRTKTK